MAHRVSNYLEVFGNPACVNAFEHTQSRLAALTEPEPCWTGASAETGILGPAPVTSLRRHIRPWPNWVTYESQAEHMLALGSANWPVEELQDALVMRLAPVDPAVIVRLQWHNWPTGCGTRLAFGFQSEVVALAAECSLSDKDRVAMQDRYRVLSADAADTEVMWQSIETCSQEVTQQIRRHPWWQAFGSQQTFIQGEDR